MAALRPEVCRREGRRGRSGARTLAGRPEGATYYYREAPTRRPASHLPQGECSLTMARADFRSVAMKKCINALSRHRDCTAAVIPAERSESRNPLAARRRARPGPRPEPFRQPTRRCAFRSHQRDLRSRPRCSMGSGSALGFASLARNDEGVGWDKPATAGRRSKTTSATDRLDSASALPTCAERL